MRGDRLSHEQVARIFYALLRQLREEQGYQRGPVWNLLTAEEQGWYERSIELARMGLLPAQIHASWASDAGQDGWTCGPEIDRNGKTHPEMASWDELDSRYRLRFILLQMVTTGLTIDVPDVWGASRAVTAL